MLGGGGGERLWCASLLTLGIAGVPVGNLQLLVRPGRYVRPGPGFTALVVVSGCISTSLVACIFTYRDVLREE